MKLTIGIVFIITTIGILGFLWANNPNKGNPNYQYISENKFKKDISELCININDGRYAICDEVKNARDLENQTHPRAATHALMQWKYIANKVGCKSVETNVYRCKNVLDIKK